MICHLVQRRTALHALLAIFHMTGARCGCCLTVRTQQARRAFWLSVPATLGTSHEVSERKVLGELFCGAQPTVVQQHVSVAQDA